MTRGTQAELALNSGVRQGCTVSFLNEAHIVSLTAPRRLWRHAP